MPHERKQPRDAATFGDAQRPDAQTGGGEPHTADRVEHAEIRENVPGKRDDLNAENNQGVTGPPGGGEVGDRDSQSPASEAASRTDPRGGVARQRHERIPHQRETAEMSPDDFDSEDTVN